MNTPQQYHDCQRSRSKRHRQQHQSPSENLWDGKRSHRQQKNYKRRFSSSSLSPSSSKKPPTLGSPLHSDVPAFNGVAHIQIRSGELLNNKFKVLKLLGDGTFGRVVECEYRGETFAVKIIKPVSSYIESAKIEKSIIKKINKHDPEDRQGIVRYLESFYHDGHYCMVFKPLGKSLYAFMKMNSMRGFPLKIVQSFFRQMLKTVGFLHKIGYTHTDLKPENILLEVDDCYETTEPGCANPFYLPKNTAIRIIDFGGATHHDDLHSSMINTRQYRSPEVILGCCKWNEISDVWSIGCIVVELLTGNQLFPTKEELQHLAMIEKNCGKFPGWMLHKLPRSSRLRRLFLDGLIDQDQIPTLDFVVRQPTLEQMVGEPSLLHLLRECLEINPNRRINCREALRHPFFQTQI